MSLGYLTLKNFNSKNFQKCSNNFDRSIFSQNGNSYFEKFVHYFEETTFFSVKIKHSLEELLFSLPTIFLAEVSVFNILLNNSSSSDNSSSSAITMSSDGAGLFDFRFSFMVSVELSG